jgi:hypothetical protein
MIKTAAQSSLLNDTRYTSMSAGAVPSTEYLIESRVLDTAVSSVTFSDLAQYAGVYKHLQLVACARSTRADVDSAIGVQFNGVTSGYFWHELQGNGSAVASSALTSQTSMRMGFTTGNSSAANAFGATVLDVLDPYSTTKNKTFRALTGGTNLNRIRLTSGSLALTNSLTEIKLLDLFANFAIGSRFSLYGVTA